MTAGKHQPARGLEVYRRLLGYTRRYWPWLVFAVLAMILQGASEPAFAALLKPLIDGSFVEQDPWIQRWAPLFIILIFAARGIGSFFSTWFMSAVGRKVIQDLRNDVFEKLVRLPVRYYDTTSSGELLAKLLYNVEQVAAAATSVITTLIRDSIKVIGLLGYMIWVNWQLSLLFMILGPLIALIVSWVTRRFRNLSHRIQNSMGDLSHVSEELIDGHRVIRMFGGEEYERRRFHEVNERNRLLQMKMVATDAASSPIVQFIVALAIAGIVFYITTHAEELGVTIGSFISFLAALGMMLQPIKSLTQINSALQRGIAAGESIFELLDLEEEHDTGTRVLERPRGEIEYQGVSFSYDAQKGRVLDHVDLHVPAGSTVALVGHSGSGKTTLVNLLPRFYEVDEGRILIDGTDIREYTLASLRGQIAHVGQDVTLFNDTIARNIAYGAMQDASMEAIREAARAAHALGFIEALPQGFDTMVGENGVLLSGGQRQRLAIARALLKNAPILILDEATSALDTEAERHIQAALETLMRDRTTLVIAHRLSTIENADLIVVLAEGRIIERGTHAELLSLDGHYARLHRMQFREPHHV